MHGHDWNLELYACPFSVRSIFNPYLSAVGLHYSARDGQPHAKTRLRSGAEEFLKHLSTQRRGDAGTFIAYGEADIVSFLPH